MALQADAALDQPVAWPRPDEGDGLGGPPRWSDAMGMWVVSAYADAERVLNDPGTFASHTALGPQYEGGFDPLRARVDAEPEVATASHFFRMPIQIADGDLHRRERSFVAKAFTPGRVRRFLPFITTLCEELTDAMVGRDDVRFVREFAVPLPVRVIAQALGVPADDHSELKRLSDGLRGPIGDPTPENLEEFVRSANAFTAYLTPIIEQRRREPTDDLISVLAGVNDAGERLSVEEILPMCMALTLGGNETTTAGLSGMMLYLVRVPEIQARLRAEPALRTPFIEDTLRLSSPVQLMFRTATTDTEIAGVRIARGDHVLLRLAAVNRDEQRFACALRPQVDRPDKRHLAFSRGVHVCPGAPLARAELEIALDTLLDRTSAIVLTDGEGAVEAEGNPMTAAVGELHLEVRA